LTHVLRDIGVSRTTCAQGARAADVPLVLLMTILIDLMFLLLAAAGGATAAGLVVWLRMRGKAAKQEEAAELFARDTLARLQELTHRVAADIDQHAEEVEEINAVLENDENDEESVVAAVAQLIEANNRMKRQLDSAEERLEAQAIQIESQTAAARTDPLTKVANRRALDDELARCVADFQRRGTPMTMMLLDVDHFKKFNDTHGHQAGDAALVSVARAVQGVVGDLGLVARWGGEEFAVVFGGRPASEAVVLCEKARQAISGAPIRFGGRELRVSASAGVAEILTKESQDDVVGRADRGLYASKKAGRNCGHIHDGRVCRLLRLQSSAGSKGHETADRKQETAAEKAAAAAHPAVNGPKVGDEWLFDPEIPTEALFHEPLTNVASRPEFFDGLIRRLGELRRGGPSLTLLLVQVDGYSRIVSDHGPTCAEAVLRIAAQLINASMRDMDTLARLSEDTFAVLRPGEVLSDCVTIAERLRQAVERCKLPRKTGVNFFTVSAGVVQADRNEDLRRLLERGRAALTQAVNQGRNRVISHRSSELSAQERARAGVGTASR
jgi:diguanylate cyclase